MNNILGDFSKSLFDSPLRVSDLRQTTQAIYSQHFQGKREAESIMETANRMGNHSTPVANRYYDRPDNIATEDPGLSSEVIKLCIACSKAWHCWLGLIPYDNMINQELGSLLVLQRQQNHGIAQLVTGQWLFRNKGKILPPENIHNLFTRSLIPVRLTTLFSVQYSNPFY